jgi:hypothetical protein
VRCASVARAIPVPGNVRGGCLSRFGNVLENAMGYEVQ